MAEHAMVSLAIALGLELNLFDALAEMATEATPITAEEIGKAKNLKPR